MKKSAIIVASLFLFLLLIAWQVALFVGRNDISPPETSDLAVTRPLIPDADNERLKAIGDVS